MPSGAGIAERKKAQDDLKDSETRYRRLFETAQDGILILDGGSGEIKDVNPFLTAMLGYPFEELIGKKLWELGLFKDIAASKSAFSELQAKGYVRYEDLPLETKDGRKIDVEFVSNVYQVDHTKVIQCNIRNITDRKKAEDLVKKMFREMEGQNLELTKFNKAMVDREIRMVQLKTEVNDLLKQLKQPPRYP